MAITVKHKFVSAIPDAGDPTIVQPSNWNDDHDLTGTIPVANGGTGASTLTGYVKGNGTAAMTASATVPSTDITGLGTASTKDAGVANGVATLDAGGKVPVSELPAAVLGALSYQGTWDASTNTPTLTSSVGTKGYYYVVNVAGNTNLNGITDWLVGDWAVYNGTVWQKVDNTETVTSVNGQTGAVVLTTTNIAEGTNLYYTDARARAAISAGTGISYNNGTGVVTNAAPDQTVVLTAGTGISTSGTYPNFTITNTSPSLGGDVVGPTGATDNAIARYDTTTGKLLQNSLVIIGDTGSVTGVNALTAESLTVNNNATLGSSNTDTLDVRARISSDLDPETNNAKDLGTNGRNWRDGFFGRTVHTVNLELTGTTSFDGSQGTAGQVLTSAGTGNTPTWTTPTTGTVTSVTGTAPVVSSGGNTPAISMAAATGSVNGYLTSTDWTTFNGKYSVGGALGTPSSGTVTNLTGTASININGTVGATTANTGVFTTATANSFIPNLSTVPTNGMYLPAANTVGFATNSSEKVRVDSTGNVGIGLTSPSSYGILATAGNINNLATALGTADAATVSILNNNVGGLGVRASLSMNIASIGKSVIAGYYAAFNGSNDIGTGLQFGTQTNAAGGTVERMRINQLGNVGIGTTTPSASAILDVQSTTKGVRMPNMTTTQKNAIASPAAGLMVFDTTLSKLCVYSGIAWETITSI
jgi:hypothetical protein